MMIHYGASNAQAFAVHHGSTPIGIAGTALTSPKALDVWGRKNTVTDINIFRSTAPGQQWGWTYKSENINPLIRVIRTSTGTPVYVWEAETPVDNSRQYYVPLLETDDYGIDIIPSGGSAVWITLPGETELDTIKTEVESSSAPSWATGTIWSGYSAAELIREMFRNDQGRVGLRLHSTISEVFDWLHSKDEYDMYILIWLRIASKILYSHYGNTCIPLILDKFSVDTAGMVTLA